MSDTTTIDTPIETLWLSALLRDAVVDALGKTVGSISDVIVTLQPDGYPLIAGLVMRVGASNVFVPVSAITSIDNSRIALAGDRLDLARFERHSGEVLLKEAVLGHRVIDVERAVLVRAYDIQISLSGGAWVVTGIDVHKRGWFSRATGEHQTARDWKSLEALIGHEPSLGVRSAFGRLRGLKPAQIADLIETASTREREDLLDHLNRHPELEADVFEELEDNHQTRVLKVRSTEAIADILSRMRTDDAVDAILDLPQDRRKPVVDALPESKRADVLRLMRYQDASAGGLMGVEYLAVEEHNSIEYVLGIVRESTSQQPEALSTIFSVDAQKRLVGTLSLVRAIQADPSALLCDVCDSEPVHADPRDDLVDVTNLMADYNLLSLPILDGAGVILGVITVDDALEAAIPDDWRRRDRRQHATTQPLDSDEN